LPGEYAYEINSINYDCILSYSHNFSKKLKIANLAIFSLTFHNIIFFLTGQIFPYEICKFAIEMCLD
jgi:hypothetical protein